MDYQTFRTQFITQFLASWHAVNYEKRCMTGIRSAPPCEDAEFLAEQAWQQLADVDVRKGETL